MKSKSWYEYKFNPASNEIPEYEVQENRSVRNMIMFACASPFIMVGIMTLIHFLSK